MDKFTDKPVSFCNPWPRALTNRLFVQHSDGSYTCMKCRNGPLFRLALSLHSPACIGSFDVNSPVDALTRPMDVAANLEITDAMGLKARNALFKEQIQKAMTQGGANIFIPRYRQSLKRKAVPSLPAELVDEPGHGEAPTGMGQSCQGRMDDQVAPST